MLSRHRQQSNPCRRHPFLRCHHRHRAICCHRCCSRRYSNCRDRRAMSHCISCRREPMRHTFPFHSLPPALTGFMLLMRHSSLYCHTLTRFLLFSNRLPFFHAVPSFFLLRLPFCCFRLSLHLIAAFTPGLYPRPCAHLPLPPPSSSSIVNLRYYVIV